MSGADREVKALRWMQAVKRLTSRDADSDAWRPTLLMLASLWTSTGCTAVGMLAGHGVDTVSDRPMQPQPASSVTQVTPGTEVCMDTSTRGQEHLCGTYRGVTAIGLDMPVVHVLIDTGDRVALIPAPRVRRLFVAGRGYAWLYGGAIGLVADVALLVAASQVRHVNLEGDDWQF